jgi:hypothetical protein
VTALVAHALESWKEILEGDLEARAGKAIDRAVKWIDDYLSREDPRRADSFGAAYILEFLLARAKKIKDPAREKAVEKAVEFLIGGQCPGGAWSYNYRFGVNWKGGFASWPKTDKGRVHSMNTGLALLALAKTKEQGFAVDEEALARGVKATLAMRSGPGTYTYTHPVPRIYDKPNPSIARGPVCEQALYVLQAVEKKDLEQAVATFMKIRRDLRIPAKLTKGWVPPHGHGGYFYFFAYYHGALAIEELGGELAKKRLQALRIDIRECTELDATWLDWHQAGKAYATAMALRILHMARKRG